jgi:hypothetical protein
MRETARAYYEAHKDDPWFKEQRADYMRKWRNKLR